jgi:glucuronosyltransferase
MCARANIRYVDSNEGHKKIRLFISHGGGLGSLEAIYHGVPVLGMPIRFDQFSNMHNPVRNGYALQLDVRNFTEKALEDTIRKLIDEPRYPSKL